MVICPGGFDVKREASLYGETLEGVRKQAQRQSTDSVAREGKRHLGVRAAAEVDRGRAARLVHRHRRRAVAAETGPGAERLSERFAQRGQHVLDSVVLIHLEIASGQDL